MYVGFDCKSSCEIDIRSKLNCTSSDVCLLRQKFTSFEVWLVLCALSGFALFSFFTLLSLLQCFVPPFIGVKVSAFQFFYIFFFFAAYCSWYLLTFWLCVFWWNLDSMSFHDILIVLIVCILMTLLLYVFWWHFDCMYFDNLNLFLVFIVYFFFTGIEFLYYALSNRLVLKKAQYKFNKLLLSWLFYRSNVWWLFWVTATMYLSL